jgi:hypothetical protein
MRILMLGNSLTTAHGLPDTPRLASLAPRFSCTPVAARAWPSTSTQRQETAPARLRPSRRWAPTGTPRHILPPGTYVVLQEMSHAPATTPEAYARSASALCALARAAGATPVIYATWAYRAGEHKARSASASPTPRCTTLCTASFAQVAANNHAVLADACDAFYYAPDPAALYAPDGVHPSELGTRVAASVLAQCHGLRDPQVARYVTGG